MTNASSATARIEFSANEIDWLEVKACMAMQDYLATEILIAPGMMPEFKIRLDNRGFISKTHSLNIFRFNGVPVVEHPLLAGKTGMMRYANGDVVPFFWGEKA